MNKKQRMPAARRARKPNTVMTAIAQSGNDPRCLLIGRYHLRRSSLCYSLVGVQMTQMQQMQMTRTQQKQMKLLLMMLKPLKH